MSNAHRHAEECDYALELAREAVFCFEAEEMARYFMARLMDMRRLSMQLRFMSVRQMRKGPDALNVTGGQFYGDGGMRKVSMSPFVANAVQEDCIGDYDRRGGLKLRDDIGRAVASWWAALRVDPLAQFDAGEAIKSDPHAPLLLERAS